MIDSQTALDKAIEDTPAEIRAVLALLVHRLGGDVSFDAEDAAGLRGKSLSYECERGTVRIRVVLHRADEP